MHGRSAQKCCVLSRAFQITLVSAAHVSRTCRLESFIILIQSMDVVPRLKLIFNAYFCGNIPFTRNLHRLLVTFYEDRDNNNLQITYFFSQYFFLSAFIKKSEACSTENHQKKDPILHLTTVLLCASTSSIISDPFILIAYPQTQRRKKDK